MMKLTTMEIKVLNAMRSNCFNDILQDGDGFVFAVIEESGLEEEKARGVISSLIKKGLIEVEEVKDDDNTMSFTDTGLELWEVANGKENKSWGGLLLLKEEEEEVFEKTKKEVIIEVGMQFKSSKTGNILTIVDIAPEVLITTSKNGLKESKESHKVIKFQESIDSGYYRFLATKIVKTEAAAAEEESIYDRMSLATLKDIADGKGLVYNPNITKMEIINQLGDVNMKEIKIKLPKELSKRIHGQLNGKNVIPVKAKEIIAILQQYIPRRIDINTTSLQDVGVAGARYEDDYMIVTGDKFVESYEYVQQEKNKREELSKNFSISINKINNSMTSSDINNLHNLNSNNNRGLDGYIIDNKDNLLPVRYNYNYRNKTFYVNGKSWSKVKNKISYMIFCPDIDYHVNELEMWSNLGYNHNKQHRNKTYEIVLDSIKSKLNQLGVEYNER